MAENNDQDETLRVQFPSVELFRSEFQENLAHGVVFVTTKDSVSVHESVKVMIDLLFCGESLIFDGSVVSVLAQGLEESRLAHGISIQLSDNVNLLRSRLEGLTGVNLEPTVEEDHDERRASVRMPARGTVKVVTQNITLTGETMNISYSGALLSVPGAIVDPSTKVRVVFTNPITNGEFEIEGQVVRHTGFENGLMAMGIQWLYRIERIDEVMAFIDILAGYEHARRLGSIEGDFRETGLGNILEMFMNTSQSGTLTAYCGNDEGVIGFKDGNFCYSELGIVRGIKAMARMMAWNEGVFRFQSGVAPNKVPKDPEPFDSVMLQSAMQADELGHLHLDELALADKFHVDQQIFGQERFEMTEQEVFIIDLVKEGYPLRGILDLVPEPDVQIYRTVLSLRERGVLERIR